MKKNIYFSLIALLVSFFLLSVKTVTLASTRDEENVGFDIQMIPSDAQHDRNSSYFDLRLSPNEQKKISIQVNNTSNEDSTFDVQVNQAYTNAQGFIDYKDSRMSEENNYPIDIKNIVTYPKEIFLKAHESTTFQIDLQMPSQPFDGQVMAGIQVNKKVEKTAENSITNSYGYILGLVITETDNSVKRDIALKSVEAAVKFGQPTIVANIENLKMDAIGHLVYDVTIIEKGSGKNILKKEYNSDMQLAPNSNYPFAIEFGDQRLVAGNYTLSLKISDAQNNQWRFSKDFTIANKEATQINKLTIDQGKESGLSWNIALNVIFFLLLLVAIICWFFRKKKKGS